jgi:hypothetical protein
VKAAFAVFAAGALVGLAEMVAAFLPDRLQIGLGLIAIAILLVESLTLLGITLAGREEGARLRVRWAELPLAAKVAVLAVVAALVLAGLLGHRGVGDAIEPAVVLTLAWLGAWRTLLLRNHRRALADPPF